MVQSDFHAFGSRRKYGCGKKAPGVRNQMCPVKLGKPVHPGQMVAEPSSVKGYLQGPFQWSDILTSNHRGTGQARLIIITV